MILIKDLILWSSQLGRRVTGGKGATTVLKLGTEFQPHELLIPAMILARLPLRYILGMGWLQYCDYL